MAMRDESRTFETEREAQEYADNAKAQSIPGYSEVYVSGPYQSSLDGLWHVSTKEYHG